MLDWLRSLFASSVRVYIYLPLTYNPDPQGVRLPIPDAEYYRVLTELETYLGTRFSGLSSEIYSKRHVQGIYKGLEEEMRVIHIDLELTRADRQWFRQMKEVWRQRFEQEELHIQVLKRERL